MIVTLIKLFEMRIVASSLSESDNKVLICSSAGLLSSSISFKSPGVSEKKAISEAETKPEAINKKPANTMAMIAPNEGEYTVTSANKSVKACKNESGSK